MTNFNLKKYWEDRYQQGGNSGAGSYEMEAMLKASFINTWINDLKIRKITEIGCGDGNNLIYYDVRMSYCGYDISPKAIEMCKEKTRKIRNSLFYEFYNNPEDIDYDAELCLCLDVWYHQVDDEDFKSLTDMLFAYGNWKYVIIYSYEENPFGDEKVGLHVKYRDVLSEVEKYPNWELMHWVSGYSNNHLPSKKKMFLFKRVEST
jgi:SAM-dependent methyltransferase